MAEWRITTLLQWEVWGELSKNSSYGLDLACTGVRLENTERKVDILLCKKMVHAREFRVFLETESGYMGESVIIVKWCNTGDKNHTG